MKLLLNWAKENGAIYAELNYGGNDRRLRFWKSVGFIENGVDEWGEPLILGGTKTMLKLKKMNYEDIVEQWKYVTALPKDENGLTNQYEE